MINQPVSSLLSLNDKSAVVTGAVGIGLSIASRLAEAGAKVLVAGNIPEEVENSVSQLKSKGYTVEGIVADVSLVNDVQKIVEKATNVFGGVDILVNNAGIYPSKPIAQMEPEDFDKVISVNLKGVYLTTKYISNQMIRQGKGGKIINITSIDALHPSAVGLAHYDASKHGVWGFTKNSALELAQHKIWVNAIAPGGILTPGVQAQQSNPIGSVDMTKVMEAFLQKIPMHRLGDPDDIGKVALFLASDMASYITGTQLVVDGGVLLS